MVPTDLVVGETYPAYSYHLREIGDVPVNLGGHVRKPLSLCGREIAWDTQIPVAGFDDCKRCVAEMEKRKSVAPDADTADVIALQWIAQNPGKHGDEMPARVARRLDSLFGRKLVGYHHRNGWRAK